MTDDLTAQKHAADADAAGVDLDQAERVADLWLAATLRRLAGDPVMMARVLARLDVLDLNTTYRSVLNAVADILEADH